MFSSRTQVGAQTFGPASGREGKKGNEVSKRLRPLMLEQRDSALLRLISVVSIGTTEMIEFTLIVFCTIGLRCLRPPKMPLGDRNGGSGKLVVTRMVHDGAHKCLLCSNSYMMQLLLQHVYTIASLHISLMVSVCWFPDLHAKALCFKGDDLNDELGDSATGCRT